MLTVESDESLVCVEVPGKVENPDRLVKMIGGTENLCKTFFDKNRRLELRFRPEDPHCKPTCGERVTSTSYLLRVKVMKRKKGSQGSNTSDDGEEIKLLPEIISPVTITYKFSNLCDFQYLPFQKKKDVSGDGKTFESILDLVRVIKLERADWMTRDLEKTPLFLPPAAFSRMDTVQDYSFRRDVSNLKAVSQMPQNIIGRTRQRRSHHAIFVMYDVDQVPDVPKENASKQIQVKFIQKDDFEKVKLKFQEHPVWSKNALTILADISQERLKYILPAVAYYFTTGPWRNFWVRLGYDPRKDPGAAIYQSLDYRVRVEGGISQKVKAKRNYANYLLPYKATNWSKPKVSLIQCGSELNPKEAKTDSDSNKDNMYLFRPGLVPPYRQMFYMYKHIQVEEAQTLMAASLKPPGSTCDEKNGWYHSGLDAKLRDILTKEIKKVIQAETKLEDLLEDEAEK